jgi:glutathione S-transferase
MPYSDFTADSWSSRLTPRKPAILDDQLAHKTYLVAEQFSLADVCYMPFLEFLPLMEIGPPAAVAGWSQRLLARPSAAATRPEK